MYTCLVCGYNKLVRAPFDKNGIPSFATCPCCLFEFGVTDDEGGYSLEEFRKIWIEKYDFPFSNLKLKPKTWNRLVLQKQLNNLNSVDDRGRALPRASLKHLGQLLYGSVIGKKPHNTIFSYNYHNISHITRFLSKATENIKREDNTLVDIGCGNSPYFEIFKNKVTKYIAVDLQESLPKKEYRLIDQKVGIAEKLPIDNDSVHIVLSNQVLEHVTDPHKAIQESYRVLKKGGCILGSVPHMSPIHLEPHDFRRYTSLGLQKLLKENGFKKITIEGNGGVYKTAAVILTMDWLLSPKKEGQEQRSSSMKALMIAPAVGVVNALASMLDNLFADKDRSATNYCFLSVK